MKNRVEGLEGITPLERYQVFRGRIEHEDNLVMQRLSWLMASQSFLFTAYAIVSNALSASTANKDGKIFVGRLSVLEDVIPIVALLNSLLIFVSIMAALIAIRELRRQYHNHPENLDGLGLQTHRITRVLGFAAPVILPLLFLSVWLFLLVR
ncbi:MAG TPA: hypothetical protein VKV04_14325 [Verrucomicrobiae bacterium]|nr:hypothetical protein [Verrucomicrobiae bacterium]